MNKKRQLSQSSNKNSVCISSVGFAQIHQNSAFENQQMENIWRTIVELKRCRPYFEQIQRAFDININGQHLNKQIGVCSYRQIGQLKKSEKTKSTQSYDQAQSSNLIEFPLQSKEAQYNSYSYQKDDFVQQSPSLKGCQTKHMIKNFGRAIIAFIIRNKDNISECLRMQKRKMTEFVKHCRRMRSKLMSIRHLKGMWLQEQNKYAKEFRTITEHYLRKHSFKHIFNSRVVNYSHHLKSRTKFIEAVRKPKEFNNIKVY